MKTPAAVALEKAKPLQIAEVELDGPKAGEVLVEVKATGICHTDEFTLSGADPEGLFPAILGHEGADILSLSTVTGIYRHMPRARHPGSCGCTKSSGTASGASPARTATG